MEWKRRQDDTSRGFIDPPETSEDTKSKDEATERKKEPHDLHGLGSLDDVSVKLQKSQQTRMKTYGTLRRVESTGVTTESR